MKKVSFLGGYKVLDDKLYDRIYDAVEDLASKETGLDFMFFYTILTDIIVDKEPFMETCYQAVTSYCKTNPDKKTTRTLLVRKPEEVEEWQNKYGFYHWFDSCICPVADKKTRYLTAIINQADYMICQLYTHILDKTDQQFYQMIPKEKRIMVTSEDVKGRIAELMLQLPESTQYIFDRINAGEDYIHLAKKLQMEPDVISNKHIDAILNIQKCLAGEKSYFD